MSGYWCEERQSPPIHNEPSIMQQEQMCLCILHERVTGFKNQTKKKKMICRSGTMTSINSASQVARWAPSPEWSFGKRDEKLCHPIALPLWALGSLFHLNLCLICFQSSASPHKTYLRPSPMWISHVYMHRSGDLVLVLVPLGRPVAGPRWQSFFQEMQIKVTFQVIKEVRPSFWDLCH